MKSDTVEANTAEDGEADEAGEVHTFGPSAELHADSHVGEEADADGLPEEEAEEDSQR